MKTTTNYGLKKPDGTDVVNIDDFNYNADIIDTELVKRALKTDIPSVPISSVNGRTGAVVISKSDVGLSNVNNWGATTAVNSTSTTTYATASAVKQAYDKAVEAASNETTGKNKLVTALSLKGISVSSDYTNIVSGINQISSCPLSINGVLQSGNYFLTCDSNGIYKITNF